MRQKREGNTIFFYKLEDKIIISEDAMTFGTELTAAAYEYCNLHGLWKAEA